MFCFVLKKYHSVRNLEQADNLSDKRSNKQADNLSHKHSNKQACWLTSGTLPQLRNTSVRILSPGHGLWSGALTHG